MRLPEPPARDGAVRIPPPHPHPGRAEGVPGQARRPGRVDRGRPGRGRRVARAQRRRQDDDLLHRRRPDPTGPGPGLLRRHRDYRPAHVPPGAAGHQLSPAGAIRVPATVGRRQPPRRVRDPRSPPRRAAAPDEPVDRRLRSRRGAALKGESAFPAANGVAWRSPARWRSAPASSFSTSRSPESIRSPFSTSRRSCVNFGTWASGS